MTPSGIRFGKGHGYFDLEWAMMWSMGLVDLSSVVIGMGHDCQVVDADVQPAPYDTIVDYIVTTTKVIKTEKTQEKPTLGILWDKLEKGMFENIPPLQEVYQATKA